MRNIAETNNPPSSPLPTGPGPDRGRGRQALPKGEVNKGHLKIAPGRFHLEGRF